MKEKVTVYELSDTANRKVLTGTINDVRTWAKNKWGKDAPYMLETLGIEVEEDLYLLFDDELKLREFLDDEAYRLRGICEVPLDDFYDEQKPTQELIDSVLFQIKKDIDGGDLTALDEMLKAMPIQQLVSYLPEK